MRASKWHAEGIIDAVKNESHIHGRFQSVRIEVSLIALGIFGEPSFVTFGKPLCASDRKLLDSSETTSYKRSVSNIGEARGMWISL